MAETCKNKEPGAPCACGGGGCGGGSGKGGWIILAVVVLGLMLALNWKRTGCPAAPASPAAVAPAVAAGAGSGAPSAVAVPAATGLPRLVDLGAGLCLSCKMMAPVLAELKSSLSNELDVVFVDVGENPKAVEQYKVHIIPTQIFYAPDGRELFRHEGFFSREQILEKWRELGMAFKGAPAPAAP